MNDGLVDMMKQMKIKDMYWTDPKITKAENAQLRKEKERLEAYLKENYPEVLADLTLQELL